MTQITLIPRNLTETETEEEARRNWIQQAEAKPCIHCGDRVTNSDSNLCDFCDDYLQESEQE